MMSWHMNGGFVTSEQLDALPRERYAELMDWLAALPTFAVVETDDARPTAAPGARRMHVLCHAGIDAPRLRASLAGPGGRGAGWPGWLRARHGGGPAGGDGFPSRSRTCCGFGASSGRTPRGLWAWTAAARWWLPATPRRSCWVATRASCAGRAWTRTCAALWWRLARRATRAGRRPHLHRLLGRRGVPERARGRHAPGGPPRVVRRHQRGRVAEAGSARAPLITPI